MIGVTFARLGYDAFAAPGGRVATAAPLLAKLRKAVPPLPDDETLVRVNGGVQAAAGAVLATGIAPQLAAGALAASLVPTTLAGHAFWELEDPAARAGQRVQFLKNLAMFGGLLLVVARRRRGGRCS